MTIGPRVVVFSPNPGSLYTTAVCELLLRRGIAVSAVVVRRFTWKRFRQEFARDGRRVIQKAWDKLVMGERARTAVGLASFRQAHAISWKSIWAMSERYDFPIVSCGTLNDAHVEKLLRNVTPALVVFTGGGLIREHILSASGAGVVNCHAGVLPDYRGMDVVEWAALSGDFEKIGCTVHFMNRGLDTGDILRVHRVRVVPGDTCASIRNRIEALMPEALVDAVAGFLDGTLERLPQKVEDGLQYFVMHPSLYARADERLARVSDRCDLPCEDRTAAVGVKVR